MKIQRTRSIEKENFRAYLKNKENTSSAIVVAPSPSWKDIKRYCSLSAIAIQLNKNL